MDKEKKLISSYRLGDLYYNLLYDNDKDEIIEKHANTIASDYILSDEKGIETITNIILKHVEKNKNLLPEDIETSTDVHLRLGDVISGNEWHEKIKRPIDVDFYKNIEPTENTYVIGKPFFAKTSSSNYDECIKSSDEYRETIIRELNAKYFDGGHADIDLCCAIKCKRFVQGRGYFSSLIVEVRKKLNLENIETSATIEESKKKKVALINTFCNNEEKVNILKDNINKIKNLGIDVIVISPIPLKQEIINSCDYFFQTKDNPLLTWPVRCHTHWYQMPISNGRITTIHRAIDDYGWAGLFQVKKLSQIALTFDYEIFYHVIYDLEIDEVVENEFLKNNVNIVHPRKDIQNSNLLFDTTLHFMVFDREMMINIEKEIQLNEYLSTNGVAEGEVSKWVKKYNLKISEHPVKDKIFYWEGRDLFNYSPFSDFKFFVSKNEPTHVWLGESSAYQAPLDSNLKVVYHSFDKEINVTLIINGVFYNHKPTNWEIIDLSISSLDITNFYILYENKIVDFTDEFNKITMNQVYYNYRD